MSARLNILLIILSFIIGIYASPWVLQEGVNTMRSVFAGQNKQNNVAASQNNIVKNTLKLGEAAADEITQISVQTPVEFDGLTKQEIYDQRYEQIKPYEDLFSKPYTINEEIFGQIIDGRPWWGVQGQFFYLYHFAPDWPTEKSSAGVSEESRFVLNPFSLIGIDYFPIARWHEWNLDFQDEILKPDFEWMPLPEKILWDAKTKSARAVYNLTNWRNKHQKYLAIYDPDFIGAFTIDGLNARDFGFEYLHADLENTSSIYKKITTTEGKELYSTPYKMSDYIHLGRSCKQNGGCNNASPSQRYMDSFFFIKNLPAEIDFKLWKEKPQSIEQAPDFIFTLVFE